MTQLKHKNDKIKARHKHLIPYKKSEPFKVRGDAEGGKPLWLFIIVHHLCPRKARKLQRVQKADRACKNTDKAVHTLTVSNLA